MNTELRNEDNENKKQEGKMKGKKSQQRKLTN